MFNNNMFGNQQSMRPNFMGAMQRRQSWMDRGAGNMSRPVSNAGYADVGTPKWGVRPAAYPFPSPVLSQEQMAAPQNSISSSTTTKPQQPQQPTVMPLQQRQQQWRQIAASTPPYINPTGRAIQSQLAQSNQSLAGSLNSRLDRRFDVNPGATAESNVQRQLAGGMIPTSSGFQPRIDTGEARNVLAGQPMGLNRKVTGMNIPGMRFDPRQNAMVRSSPYEARGIQPGSLRQDPIMAFEKFENADDFRVATDGMAAIAPGAAPTTNWSRRMEPQTLDQTGNTGLNSSYANTRMARMARRNGFGSAASFQNFMNQYNARQNRGGMVPNISPRGLAAINGNMASVGIRQGFDGLPSPVPSKSRAAIDQAGLMYRDALMKDPSLMGL